MCKHAETFNAYNGCKLHLPFLYLLCHFQNRCLWYTFQTLFARKQGLSPLHFVYENESLQHCLLNDMRQMAAF